MKRKLLATLLALCLIVGMIPVAASADNAGPWVVEFVSGSPMSYSTFDEAFSAVKSHEGYPELVYTILLTEDTKESITIKDNESAVLNIDGGVTLTNTEGQHTITVEHGGSLLVEGIGKVDNISHAKGAVYNNGYTELRGDVIFDRSQENGSDDATSGGNSWYTICNHGEMVISENVTVTTAGGGENLSTKGRYSSLIENGYQKYNSGNESSGYVEGTNYEYPSLTINGGNFSGGLNTIKNDDHGIVQINNGSFGNYYQCVVMNHHKATVTGGTFTAAEGSDKTTYGVYNCACAEDHDIGELKISGGTFTGADFAVADVSSVGGKITISNGTFIGSSGAIGISSGHTGVFSISGGTFSSNVSAYLADGYTVVENEGEYAVSAKTEQSENDVAVVDGQYFTQLQNAINAAERGETVVLLKDTEESVSIASSDDIVLDLNGNVLTLPGTMTVDGNVTVQDSTVTAGPVVSSDYESVEYDAGKIVYTGNSTAIIPQNGGSFTLLSGIIDASVAGNAIYATGNRSPENGGNTEPVNTSVTIAGGYIHSMEYGIGIAGRGAQLSVSDGVIAAEGNTAIGGNGTNSASRYDGGTTINISGGTIIGRMTAEFVEDGYIAVGIYHPQNGEMTISGGTIYADQGVGIAMRGGTLDFTGGSIISTGSASGKVGDSKVAMDCYGIQVDGDSGYYDYANCKVTISGSASVSSQSGVDSIIVTPAGDEDKITVSGGYFTSDPSKYLAEGKAAVPSDVAGYAFTVGTSTVEEVKPAAGDPAVDLTKIPVEQQAAVKSAASSVTDSGELSAAANSVLSDITQDQVTEAKEAIKAEDSGVTVGQGDTVNIYAQTYLSVTPTAYDSTEKTLTMDITPMYRVVASTKDNPEDIKVVGEVDEGANAVVLDGSEKPLENINTMTISVTLPTEFASKTVYIQHKGYEYSATADADCKITFTNPHGFSEFTFTTDSKTVATIDGTSYTSLQAAVDDATSDDIIVVKNGNVDLSATANQTVAIRNETNDVITVTINGVSRTIGKNATETFVYTSGGGIPSEPEEPTWPFTDVTEGDDWFYDAVAYVYENGIMAGTDETTFAPYMELDRAMAAQLFYNLEGKPVVTGDSTFTDVTSGHWAVDAITWAAQNDIVAGIGGNLYDPDSNVTREQFAQMLYNYAKYKGYDLTATGDLSQFPDAGSISSWAETALSWANGNGLINGHENGTIDPKGSTIRAQAASIMANFDQNVAK